jgi:deoxyribodipyrimidine photo-lyase
MSNVPAIRYEPVNGAPVRADGDYVLYWMIASRRCEWSFALERALEWCRELGLGLVVVEALRADYPWASDRLHRFVLDGMADNWQRLRSTDVRYYPYVEPETGAGKGLLEALAARAGVVVTDHFPCFFLPRMVAAAGRKLDVWLEQVDGNGLLPLRATEKVHGRAYDFRRFLQRELAPHLMEPPLADPLADAALSAAHVPREILDRWPEAQVGLLRGDEPLDGLPIDHSVPPVDRPGGALAAAGALDRFLEERIDGYHEKRNRPLDRATSELSPYLHFGQISPHRVFAAIAERQGWNPGRLGEDASGARAGWWGMSAGAEAFLDQLVTWRELGYNMSSRREDYDRFESLPDWAQKTLAQHAADRRPHLYSLEQLACGATYDELWNAAQGQLARDGVIHNYLRMLWGKKIFEWSPSARDAVDVMIELNNKYAIDGRNPNSYSGIFWCLGRYDRAWGPERPIYGKVRYMTSESTRRKLKVDDYIARYAPPWRL